ncbi:MAG: lactate dehydrogenase [Firmicutes bacterium]|nr:lactate dehydrogenase [Bacillota bacterium]
MYFYKCEGEILFSKLEYNLNKITEKEAKKASKLYFLTKLDPLVSRRSFSVSDTSLLDIKNEDINLLKKDTTSLHIPKWIKDLIAKRKVTLINTNYPTWKEVLKIKFPKKWRVNILALGDVGSTLLTGLKLLGDKDIKEIGIYSRDEAEINRWVIEMNQVSPPFEYDKYPPVKGLKKDELFDCDMFVFCASRSVPKVGSDVKDVRMIQFEGNSKIIKEYAKLAREKNFKGIFSVVSDPVDLLSKVVFLESNKDNNDNLDFYGLAPEQIRGYGLGVMNTRACYFANKNKETKHYINEGRAFGPHGEGLIIANSIENYNTEISNYLTEKAKKANLEVRKLGYKPYIAPALSSGSFSILSTINGSWHYSATFIGGVFMGAKNRLTSSGIELERLDLADDLMVKLKNTYERLEEII